MNISLLLCPLQSLPLLLSHTIGVIILKQVTCPEDVDEEAHDGGARLEGSRDEGCAKASTNSELT